MNIRPAFPDVLSDAPFRLLVASQALFDLGIYMRGAAVSWVILEITHSQLWIGLVVGVHSIPILLFATFGGVVSDRFGRRSVMLAGGALITVASAATGVLISIDTLAGWHLLALGILGGFGGALYGPAFYALLADIVHADRLSNANGILSVSESAGQMVGPLIVGLVIATSGASMVFWLVVLGNSFGLLLLLRVREPERELTESAVPFARQLTEGLRYARNTPPLPWLMLLIVTQNLFGVAIFPLMPIYADEVLEIGPEGFGLMGGVFGAGALIGAAAISVLGIHRRHAYVMFGAQLIWSIGMISFGLSRSVPLSMSILFVMGMTVMPLITSVLTMFQRAAANRMRGRVMSFYVIADALFPLGWLFGGSVAQLLGNEEALVISALLGTPVTIVALARSKELRQA